MRRRRRRVRTRVKKKKTTKTKTFGSSVIAAVKDETAPQNDVVVVEVGGSLGCDTVATAGLAVEGAVGSLAFPFCSSAAGAEDTAPQREVLAMAENAPHPP